MRHLPNSFSKSEKRLYMDKQRITNELMSRFYAGKATGEETKMILLAAEQDPNLKEEIEIMMSISDKLANIHISKERAQKVSTANVISMTAAHLPMYELAAKSREYGHDMKAPNDCVVRCEHYILQLFGIKTTVETLTEQSREKGWLKDGGTPLHHIGRLLSEFHRLSVVRRYDCEYDLINKELNDGCKIIAVVNADKLYSNNVERNIPNHAVVVLSADDKQVRIYDPQHAQEETHPTTNFMFAWQDSHYYIISVTKRGVRKYDPSPIDASSFKLEGDLEELMEAIAENAHDIWAKARLEDGWKYGDVRDDKHKRHPDLVPYSDLTDSEKKYDRIMARGTLELVQRLGYKITKD